MVWLYRDGGAGPISSGGNPEAANIVGTSWQLHKGQAGTFNVWSYVRNENATTAVMNMMDFLQDLVPGGARRGEVGPSGDASDVSAT